MITLIEQIECIQTKQKTGFEVTFVNGCWVRDIQRGLQCHDAWQLSHEVTTVNMAAGWEYQFPWANDYLSTRNLGRQVGIFRVEFYLLERLAKKIATAGVLSIVSREQKRKILNFGLVCRHFSLSLQVSHWNWRRIVALIPAKFSLSLKSIKPTLEA
jgi:hypothetical protein